ncbi:deaminase [Streptomyces albipurpureus]|uniref:Nucleoside deaminase n=1 Tax=Streptomyces albipurpureus TaxID=2897419 RepID=A0ABT0UIS5_9ACTN|nr:nucleoside deaminase [Streptomyces sp. CWNU-1]MCM2388383.1 nucleoside deaminase [Streptomyces sp. CWNU-1]
MNDFPSDETLRQVLRRAWTSFAAGNHGIGAVVVDSDMTVVGSGRNQIFDTRGGSLTLSGSPLAHAEINALYSLGGVRAPGCTLVTSLAPCPLCVGAAAVFRISDIRYLGHDPSCDGAAAGTASGSWRLPRITHEADSSWSLWCEVLPMVSSVQRHGRDSILLRSYELSRPDLLEAVHRFADMCPLDSKGVRGISFEEARAAFWSTFSDTPATLPRV